MWGACAMCGRAPPQPVCEEDAHLMNGLVPWLVARVTLRTRHYSVLPLEFRFKVLWFF